MEIDVKPKRFGRPNLRQYVTFIAMLLLTVLPIILGLAFSSWIIAALSAVYVWPSMIIVGIKIHKSKSWPGFLGGPSIRFNHRRR